MMNKIDETLCEAIDLIVNKRLEGTTFDKTILCTITDNSERGKNKYLVSDGSVSFFAFTTILDIMTMLLLDPSDHHHTEAPFLLRKIHRLCEEPLLILVHQ